MLVSVWLVHEGEQLPCTVKPAKGMRPDAASPRRSSCGRGASRDAFVPGLDSSGFRRVAEAARGGTIGWKGFERAAGAEWGGSRRGAPMGREGRGCEARVEWGPRIGRSRVKLREA